MNTKGKDYKNTCKMSVAIVAIVGKQLTKGKNKEFIWEAVIKLFCHHK